MTNGYTGSISHPQNRKFPFRGEIKIFRDSAVCGKFIFIMSAGPDKHPGDMNIVVKRSEKNKLRVIFSSLLSTATRLPEAQKYAIAFIAPEVVNFLVLFCQKRGLRHTSTVVHEFSYENFSDLPQAEFLRMLDYVCKL